ncbi:hypothetical protein [Streptomyces sp. NPDC059378]|uniref:hypothetical protein n=1 Tax=Streptomyces sp. NPDC059378 TaxID=3346815 RepID=UPI00367A883E
MRVVVQDEKNGFVRTLRSPRIPRTSRACRVSRIGGVAALAVAAVASGCAQGGGATHVRPAPGQQGLQAPPARALDAYAGRLRAEYAARAAAARRWGLARVPLTPPAPPARKPRITARDGFEVDGRRERNLPPVHYNRDTLVAAKACGIKYAPIWDEEVFVDHWEYREWDQDLHPGDIVPTHFRGRSDRRGAMPDMIRRFLRKVTDKGYAVARLEDYL